MEAGVYPAFAEDHVHALRMNANVPRHIGMAGMPLAAAKKLLCGMSLDGQAIPVGGIIPTPIGVGTIKVPRACPWGCFPSVGVRDQSRKWSPPGLVPGVPFFLPLWAESRLSWA